MRSGPRNLSRKADETQPEFSNAQDPAPLRDVQVLEAGPAWPVVVQAPGEAEDPRLSAQATDQAERGKFLPSLATDTGGD